MTSPSITEIFQAFVIVGASAFGGGGSAHIHNQIVVRRAWLSEEEFLEGLSLSQLLPGPIFANFAAHIGMKLRGTLGAVAAFVGVCLPGMLAILALSGAYVAVRDFSSPVVTGALTGVAAGAVGISLATLARVAPPGLKSRGAPLIALTAFVANGVLHLPILWVLLVLVPIGIGLNWNVKPDA
jgi:chromate transporter